MLGSLKVTVLASDELFIWQPEPTTGRHVLIFLTESYKKPGTLIINSYDSAGLGSQELFLDQTSMDMIMQTSREQLQLVLMEWLTNLNVHDQRMLLRLNP